MLAGTIYDVPIPSITTTGYIPKESKKVLVDDFVSSIRGGLVSGYEQFNTYKVGAVRVDKMLVWAIGLGLGVVLLSKRR